MVGIGIVLLYHFAFKSYLYFSFPLKIYSRIGLFPCCLQLFHPVCMQTSGVWGIGRSNHKSVGVHCVQ